MALELATAVYSAPTLETPLARVSYYGARRRRCGAFSTANTFYSAHLLEMVHFELSDDVVYTQVRVI